jgi:hypothetical protein
MVHAGRQTWEIPREFVIWSAVHPRFCHGGRKAGIPRRRQNSRARDVEVERQITDSGQFNPARAKSGSAGPSAAPASVRTTVDLVMTRTRQAESGGGPPVSRDADLSKERIIVERQRAP